MSDNRLIIAAAGSGKTTYLVNEALKHPEKRVLITTYTEANEAGIREKLLLQKQCIPSHIVVQTWFSFLLQHGARPYQGSLDDSMFENDIKGMLLVNKQSALRFTGKRGPIYWGENNFKEHYFTPSGMIYSDKVSKFIINCNKASGGAVIDRISRIYDCIYIDEVQDLAGYDLEIIKLLFKSSISIVLVGDPRQVTYQTHHERKYEKYKDGMIKDFIIDGLGKSLTCHIDETTLNVSHRNNQAICNFSSKLYPSHPATPPCKCKSCRSDTHSEHEGVFLVKEKDVSLYLDKYKPVQLRWNTKVKVDSDFPVVNLGESKGLTFDHVLIYPTGDMGKWIADNSTKLQNSTKAKLYVGITRARYSVGIVFNFDDWATYNGVEKYLP